MLNTPAAVPRGFELVRYVDVSGVSGTGVVAEGCEFTDGTVSLHWLGEWPTTTVLPSIEAVTAIHGHNGTTVIRWIEGGECRDSPIPEATADPAQVDALGRAARSLDPLCLGSGTVPPGPPDEPPDPGRLGDVRGR